jgi:hypothetical protein
LSEDCEALRRSNAWDASTTSRLLRAAETALAGRGMAPSNEATEAHGTSRPVVTAHVLGMVVGVQAATMVVFTATLYEIIPSWVGPGGRVRPPIS